jgi:hypothetical protein
MPRPNFTSDCSEPEPEPEPYSWAQPLMRQLAPWAGIRPFLAFIATHFAFIHFAFPRFWGHLALTPLVPLLARPFCII